MKNLFTATFVITSVLLTACSSAPADMKDMLDDHHEGETNVMPHGHEVMDDMMDDHHEGETNVMPHGHEDETKPTMDDHHEGEENVQPHNEEPSAAKPPSRSNTVDDHDDTGTDPHGH